MKRIWDAWLHRFRTLGDGGRGTGADGHPTPELLSAYHDDQLSLETDGEIQEHFVGCEECPELMLDLDRITTPEIVEAAKADLPDTWVDAAWRRLRSGLAAEVRPARPASRWLRNPALAWALTALLIPCTLFLGLRVDALGDELRDLREPQLNPPSWSVEPVPVLRSEDPPPPELAVPAGVHRFFLILHSAGAPPELEYGLKIRDGQGNDIWSERGLHRSAEGAFIVTLSRRFLPAGLYSFQVIGITEGTGEPFEEEFPLRLTYL